MGDRIYSTKSETTERIKEPLEHAACLEMKYNFALKTYARHYIEFYVYLVDT